MCGIDNNDLVREFASRTKSNLDLVLSAAGDPTAKKAYEVTQLINSMLGLLVLPHEHMRDKLNNDQTPLDALVSQGWPNVTLKLWILKKDIETTLGQLMTLHRNGIAHYNIRFINEGGRIAGIRLWNVLPTGPHAGKKVFEVTLTVEQLGQLATRMLRWLKDQPDCAPLREPDFATANMVYDDYALRQKSKTRDGALDDGSVMGREGL